MYFLMEIKIECLTVGINTDRRLKRSDGIIDLPSLRNVQEFQLSRAEHIHKCKHLGKFILSMIEIQLLGCHTPYPYSRIGNFYIITDKTYPSATAESRGQNTMSCIYVSHSSALLRKFFDRIV